MTPEALREVGTALREGQRRRISHGCGDGKTLLVSRSGEWVNGWCFRCNQPESAKLELSIHEHLRRMQRPDLERCEAAAVVSTVAPTPLRPFSEWTPVARLWLLRAGMGESAAAALGAGWSEELQRVVLPLRDRTGRDRSWTARAVDGRTPKYLTGLLPDDFVAEAGASEHFLGPVAVEDWLSANKLAQAGVHAVCMLGTWPKPRVMRRLLEFPKVYTWLDNDLPPKHRVNSGQQAASRLNRALRRYGVGVRNIVSDLDPKLLPRQVIRETVARFAQDPTA